MITFNIRNQVRKYVLHIYIYIFIIHNNRLYSVCHCIHYITAKHISYYIQCQLFFFPCSFKFSIHSYWISGCTEIPVIIICLPKIWQKNEIIHSLILILCNISALSYHCNLPGHKILEYTWISSFCVICLCISIFQNLSNSREQLHTQLIRYVIYISIHCFITPGTPFCTL